MTLKYVSSQHKKNSENYHISITQKYICSFQICADKQLSTCSRAAWWQGVPYRLCNIFKHRGQVTRPYSLFLGITVKEKDLGVTISADMKVSEQCGIAASNVNQILGLIRRNITYKGKKLIIPLKQ